MKQKTKSLYLMIFISFFVYIAEILILVLVQYGHDVHVASILFLHFSIVFIAGMFLLKNEKIDKKYSFGLLLLTLVTGPFGAAIFFLALVYIVRDGESSTSFAEWLDGLFPEEKKERWQEIFDRLELGQDDFSDKQALVPFIDIMTFGTDEQKRLALAKISLYYKPEFAPALLMAISDDSNPIRVQAATAITKIEQEYSDAIMNLEKKMAGKKANADFLEKLARLCDRYAQSGVLDEERQMDIREKAISYYEPYLKQKPNDGRALVELGRLYVHNKQYKNAHYVLSKYLSNEKNAKPNVLYWYAESLYYLRKFDELRVVSKHIYKTVKSKKDRAAEIFGIIKLWAYGNEIL